MRKVKVLSLLMALLLIVGLAAGCSGGGSESGTTPTTTIKFWHIWPEGDESHDFMENVILKKFREDNPDIKVQTLGVSFWDYWSKVQQAIAGGTGPDICINDMATARQRANAGATLLLDDYIQNSSIKRDDYLPGDMEACTDAAGKTCGIPFQSGVRMLFWNKSLFKEAGLDPDTPPKTLQEITEFAAKLTKRNGDAVEVIGFHPRLNNNNFHNTAWTQGGDFFDENGNPTVNSAKNVEVLTWWVDLIKQTDAKSIQSIQAQAGNLDPFVIGKAAMVIDGNWLYSSLKSAQVNFEYGVAPMPYVEGYRSNWSAGFDLELVDNKDKAKADAAWKLMEYLSSADVHLQIAKKQDQLMSNKEAMQDSYFQNDPIWKIMIAESPYSRQRQYIQECTTWYDTVVNPEIEKAEAQKVSPQEALDAAQEKLLAEIQNYKDTH